jgi:signal transduction histidine kinase
MITTGNPAGNASLQPLDDAPRAQPTSPPPSPAIHRATTPKWLSNIGHDTLYLFVGFPLAIVSFVVLVTGLSVGFGLLITLAGIPVLMGTLLAARGLANVERLRLPLVLGRPVAPARYRHVPDGLKGWFRMLLDGQLWLDVLHGIVVYPVAVFTFVVSVTWWAVALGATTWPLWSWALPDDGADTDSLAEVLGFESWLAETMLNTAIGLVFLATLPFVLRGLALFQAAIGETLLSNQRISELRARVDTLTASRAAVVDAEAQGLRRLERDLHDGPQQRLVRLTMDLSAAERRLANEDPDAAAPLVSYALTQAKEALDELRALSRGIAPPILADRGLGAALAAAVARSPLDVELDVRLPEDRRLPAAVENTAYFVVAEALANTAKHSGARHGVVSVQLDETAGRLWVQVADDGVGGASLAKGHGLAGLSDRVAALDGRLGVDSPAGGPTVLTAEIPCGWS